MSRSITLLSVAAAVLVSSTALAQSTLDQPRVAITFSPGGSTIVTHTEAASHFANYRLGLGVAVNLTPVIGIEGEVGVAFGMEQSLLIQTPDPHPGHHLPSTMGLAKSPDMVDYNINFVLSIPTGTGLIPYLTTGVGSIGLLKRWEVWVTEPRTFLAANVGAGVKWFNASRRWGLRADYRLVGVLPNDEAPPFFGLETRYAHRVYAGVLLGIGR